MSSPQYIGVTNSFSVDARRSCCGDQMCRVIQVWDNSQINQIQAYSLLMNPSRKSPGKFKVLKIIAAKIMIAYLSL
jgi:hypothetical protein